MKFQIKYHYFHPCDSSKDESGHRDIEADSEEEAREAFRKLGGFVFRYCGITDIEKIAE